MLLQIRENEYVNLANVARIVKDVSGNDTSFSFYSSTKELIAQTDWGSEFNDGVMRGLKKYGLVEKSTPTSVSGLSL
ncbi:MAG TPA: hypothetical protein VEB70_05130 [Noviherbaspirillum sp.]|nr:hypothetical protein [Noviherbaspirillum sp.]